MSNKVRSTFWGCQLHLWIHICVLPFECSLHLQLKSHLSHLRSFRSCCRGGSTPDPHPHPLSTFRIKNRCCLFSGLSTSEDYQQIHIFDLKLRPILALVQFMSHPSLFLAVNTISTSESIFGLQLFNLNLGSTLSPAQTHLCLCLAHERVNFTTKSISRSIFVLYLLRVRSISDSTHIYVSP